MKEKRTHYPAYDVLANQEEWDAHTKEIVLARLGPSQAQFFRGKKPRVGHSAHLV